MEREARCSAPTDLPHDIVRKAGLASRRPTEIFIQDQFGRSNLLNDRSIQA